MRIAQRIAETLSSAKQSRKITTVELEGRTGLTAVSIRAALSGTKDSKLSTIIAIAHELELDLVLIPKAVSASIAPPTAPTPQVKTLADAIKERGELRRVNLIDVSSQPGVLDLRTKKDKQ